MTRRFRFSLRAFLSAFIVVAVLLATLTNRAREQRETVAGLRALGWQVQYDWQGSLHGPPGPAWLRRIVGDDYFEEVVQVSFWGGEEMNTKRTEQSISFLQKLPNLINVTFWPMIPESSQNALATALPKCHVIRPPSVP